MSKHERHESKPEKHGDSGAALHLSEHVQAGAKMAAEVHTGTDKSGDHRAPAPARGDGAHIEVTPIKAVIHSRPELKIDAARSVHDLVEKGTFKRAEPASKGQDATGKTEKVEKGDKVDEVGKRTESLEKVKVVYSDQGNDPSERKTNADFRVKKDGSIEVLHDPDSNNKKEIVIEVEREQGQIDKPGEEQQNAIDALTKYCSERLMKENPDGTRAGTIEDSQGLVSDTVQNSARTIPEATERAFSQPVREQVENMQRFSGGGRGTMSPEQSDRYFTPRDQVVPRSAETTNEMWSTKEMLAGMANVREARPYEATRNCGDRGVGVGRYVLTSEMLLAWLEDLLGDPPDPDKLAKAIKDGKISPKMAKSIQSGDFKKFCDKLKAGETPSADELKEMLPKEAQEKIAEGLIKSFSEKTRDENGDPDMGKVALAMAIGHVPSEEEASRPEYKRYEEAAERMYSISQARTDNPNANLEWQDVNSKLLVAAKDAVGDRVWARSGYSGSLLEYGNLGCAASVSQIMRDAGLTGGRSASVTDLESQILNRGGQIVRNPQPGDIVIGLRGGGRGGGGSGHIGIVGENGTVFHNSSSKRAWTQASMRSVFLSGRFDDVHYVRLPSNNDTRQA